VFRTVSRKKIVGDVTSSHISAIGGAYKNAEFDVSQLVIEQIDMDALAAALKTGLTPIALSF